MANGRLSAKSTEGHHLEEIESCADAAGQGKEALPRGRVDVPLTSIVDVHGPKKLLRLGSSAGIAMRARLAARRARAQVPLPPPPRGPPGLLF